MAEEKVEQKMEAPVEKKENTVEKEVQKDVAPKGVPSKEGKENAEAKKIDEKKESTKAAEPTIVQKDVAVANAYSLKISPKASFAICKTIKGKSPDNAMKRLTEVIKGKRAIPMAAREVPHQKGNGMAGGKFPMNACKEIFEIVKQVKANALVAGIENPVITIAHANRAAAPFRRGGRRGKRTHIHLEVRDKSKLLEVRS